jgi:hypothetical protein
MDENEKQVYIDKADALSRGVDVGNSNDHWQDDRILFSGIYCKV